MLSLTGYSNLKVVHEGNQNIIYSAIRDTDKKPVLVKSLRSLTPQTGEIALLFHEYKVTEDLNIDGVVKTLGLVEEQNRYALIQEDTQGISLYSYTKKEPILDLALFYKLALQMATILGEVHKNHIIHKDIKPSNFIYHPKTQTLKLTDFNYAAKLLHEVQEIVPPKKLEGTLAYMAPEQTGRMNMNIDYRSDFYALGVTLFELLTGRLPFTSEDPLELLHAHLASSVPDICALSSSVPRSLAKIVEKLMAKDPADRYQSAIGIIADLERAAKGEVLPFKLGEKDVHDRLNLSQKLYGRQIEANALLKAYKSASDGAVEAVMVCGYSGIGKTKLVNEVHKPMVRDKGYFIQGKFDLLQRDTPYTAITQAFNHLARLILAEQENRFEEIKARLLEALGGVAQVMIDLAPELEKVLGKQPPLEALPPMETQNRMMTFFKLFLETVATKDHPLVIFIDDLQWIDSGSLKLLEYILTDQNLHHVLLIGAYRDNEVGENHPLKLFFPGKKIHFLPLGPLTVDHFQELLTDSFNRTDTKPLAELIHHRTEGNPFFCKQVINTLYKNNLIFFNYAISSWDWNLEGIKELAITANVVELMLNKLADLPEETQTLMKYASCIGNRFTIETLNVISGKTAEEIGVALWPAMQQELILTLSHGYKRVDAMSHENLAVLLSKEITYQFVHDRIQQAVYQSLSDAEKAETHIKIARLLMEKEPEQAKRERLFEVTDHYNQSHSLLTAQEKNLVIKLNYESALRSLNANAYQPMMNYLHAAMELMDESYWVSQYDLAFKVNREYALGLFLTNKGKEAEQRTSELMERAKSALDKVSLYRIQIRHYSSQDILDKTLDIGAKAISLFGIDLKRNPKKWQIYLKLARVHMLSLRHNLHTLKELSNPEIEAACEILSELVWAALNTSNEELASVSLTGMELMLRYGKPPSAGLWCALYGNILLIYLNHIPSAFTYWDIAQKMYDEHPHKYSSSIAYWYRAFYFNHLRYPIKTADKYYHLSIQDARESGNIFMASFSALTLGVDYQTSQAKSLHDILEGSKMGLQNVTEIDFKVYMYVEEIDVLTQDSLYRGVPASEEKLKELESNVLPYQNATAIIYTYLSLCRYYYFIENYEKAVYNHQFWYSYIELMKFYPPIFMDQTISALAIAKHLPSVTDYKEKWRLQYIYWKIERALKWITKRCPANNLHYYMIVKGMKKQMAGKYEEAIICYNKAAENAKKGDFLLWVAVANELAGELYYELNDHKAAYGYFKDAHYYYARFGMRTKLVALENKYPEFFKQASDGSQERESTETTSSTLDIGSVIKATQSISSQIELNQLFEKMLHITIESAGADKALFLEPKRDSWQVSAILDHKGEKEEFALLDCPLDSYDKLPRSILNVGLRSKSAVIVNNPIDDPQYNLDPYIVEHAPKSLLSLPIVHQDKIVGLVYLENNLTSGAFTHERITVLQTLASQIAISLENARLLEHTQYLYRTTERFVPSSFLQLLKREHVEDVKLGDSILANVTILFSDIRGFTTLAESWSPEETFSIVNAYLKAIAPVIRKHHGFICSYQGDGFMALFPRKPEDAFNAIVEMHESLLAFNKESEQCARPPLKVGYGINTGQAMLGIIGEEERMDANIIGDAVNLTARVEELNKFYNTRCLVADTTINALAYKEHYTSRLIDKVRVVGRKKPLSLYQVYVDKQDTERNKQLVETYEKAFRDYESKQFVSALEGFTKCVQMNPSDTPSKIFVERCKTLMNSTLPDDWDGTYEMTHK